MTYEQSLDSIDSSNVLKPPAARVGFLLHVREFLVFEVKTTQGMPHVLPGDYEMLDIL
jgi:hypothetical protein